MARTRIHIRKARKKKTVPGQAAAVITYKTERSSFTSRSERNKFYRGLYGFAQTVRKGGEIYHYEKEGLMDTIPHAKIADSVLITPVDYTPQIRQYFKRWEDKVDYQIYRIHMSQTEWNRLMHTR